MLLYSTNVSTGRSVIGVSAVTPAAAIERHPYPGWHRGVAVRGSVVKLELRPRLVHPATGAAA
jgi:hypothetical protein